jgi:hypothetical protein
MLAIFNLGLGKTTVKLVVARSARRDLGLSARHSANNINLVFSEETWIHSNGKHPPSSCAKIVAP